jgi:hypothetical protein
VIRNPYGTVSRAQMTTGESSGAPAPGVLLVTGSGRSGTSTVSGALTRLGFHVPLPEVAANASNPRGFYEPRWVVEFHKALLKTAGIRDLDARPEARARAAEAAGRPEVRSEVRAWLEPELARRAVIKDPRTVWFTDLWLDTARSLGATPACLTMLRHPAEVVGSRDTHYGQNATAEQRRQREVANVAGWVNVALVNERLTRDSARAFLHYTDLTTDWRKALGGVDDRLALGLPLDDPEAARSIDDFIDVSLHRTRLTWDDLDVPAYLRDLAEAVWQNLADLAEGSRGSEEITRSMDSLRDDYDTAYAHAVAFARDHIDARVRTARRKAQRNAAPAGQPAPRPATAAARARLGDVLRRVRRRLRRAG